MPDETPPPPPTGGDEEVIYTPLPGERQLTARAVVIGCLLGAAVAAMNITLGLKMGWMVGGSLIAAILAYGFFHVFKPRNAFTPLETNIAQTAGSAAGSMTAAAGLVAPIPAYILLMQEADPSFRLSYWELTLWAAAVAYIGVFYAVPLRRQMILVEKLRFPTGTATAHTIVAMFGSGAETLRKARTLLWWGIVAAAFTLLAYFVPQVENPPLATWFPAAILTVPATYSFMLYLSPMLIGAGVLVGMRVSLSLFAGAIVGWAILAPLVEHWGWVEAGKTLDPKVGARAWILWPGVGIMVGDAMTNLALAWPSIVGTFRRSKGGADDALEDPKEAIPNWWWTGGLLLATVAAVIMMYFIFDIAPWMTVLAIALSSVLAAIATRSTGETDINPISGVGKVTQLVYGGIAPGMPGVNLLAAGITGAGASQAADMMQDLKTGHMLGASPRKQFKAQLWGIGAGILICIPIYILVTSAHGIGSKEIPAPSAFAWKAVAEVLSEGMDQMPTNAQWGALVGLLVGIAIPLLGKLRPAWKKHLPSGLAFGIAFLVFAFQSLCFLYGAIAFMVWKKRSPLAAAALSFAVASGLIAGEGLMGIVTATLKLLGVSSLTGGG